jgi:hypothetical protein
VETPCSVKKISPPGTRPQTVKEIEEATNIRGVGRLPCGVTPSSVRKTLEHRVHCHRLRDNEQKVQKRSRPKKSTGSEGIRPQRCEPQESIGSASCAIPGSRTRLFEGNKALKSRFCLAYPAGANNSKGMRANNLEKRLALFKGIKALKGRIPRTLGLETTVQRSWEE